LDLSILEKVLHRAFKLQHLAQELVKHKDDSLFVTPSKIPKLDKENQRNFQSPAIKKNTLQEVFQSVTYESTEKPATTTSKSGFYQNGTCHRYLLLTLQS
jgi:hypothetical protein